VTTLADTHTHAPGDHTVLGHPDGSTDGETAAGAVARGD